MQSTKHILYQIITDIFSYLQIYVLIVSTLTVSATTNFPVPVTNLSNVITTTRTPKLF